MRKLYLRSPDLGLPRKAGGLSEKKGSWRVTGREREGEKHRELEMQKETVSPE